jgi:hypothetical protein
MSDIVSGELYRFWGMAESKPRKAKAGQKRDNGHAWNGNFHTNSPVPLPKQEQESLLHALGLQPASFSTSTTSSSSSSLSSSSTSPDSNTPWLYIIKATSGPTTAYVLACGCPALVKELECRQEEAAASSRSSMPEATAVQAHTATSTGGNQLSVGGVQHAVGLLGSLWGSVITSRKKVRGVYGRKLIISKYAFVVHNSQKIPTKKSKSK